jgi:hypothetical protein
MKDVTKLEETVWEQRRSSYFVIRSHVIVFNSATRKERHPQQLNCQTRKTTEYQKNTIFWGIMPSSQ